MPQWDPWILNDLTGVVTLEDSTMKASLYATIRTLEKYSLSQLTPCYLGKSRYKASVGSESVMIAGLSRYCQWTEPAPAAKVWIQMIQQPFVMPPVHQAYFAIIKSKSWSWGLIISGSGCYDYLSLHKDDLGKLSWFHLVWIQRQSAWTCFCLFV